MSAVRMKRAFVVAVVFAVVVWAANRFLPEGSTPPL
jgi:hypothetical protein